MYEEKVISRDSGTCTVFHQYSPPDHMTPLKKSLFCIKQYNIKCFYLF